MSGNVVPRVAGACHLCLMRIRRLLQPVLPLAICLLLAACGRTIEAETIKTFTNGYWRYADSLELPYTAPDTTPRRLVLELTIDGKAYPYRNLWVQTTVVPPGGTAQQSRIEFVLASPEGEWNIARSGDGYGARAVLAPQLKLQPGKPYIFRVAQLMRTDTLLGVQEVAVRVER